MSASARAEARKKAILSRGTDRLSKLTASARGDDAPQFVHTDQPPPYSPPRGNLANFIGEDPLPTSPVPDQPTRPPPDLLAGPPPGSPAWSNEQQHQFLQSLLDSAPNEPFPAGVNMPPGTPGAGPEDPLLAFMSSLGVGEGVFQGDRGVPQSQMEEKPKTFVQKILPLLHPMAMWALVAFFIFWREPESFRARHSAVNSSGDVWNRWAQLAGGPAHSWSIEPEPFFWAFVSLELALHSMRIFFGFDSTQRPTRRPMLLSLALMHLPQPLSSMLLFCSKYLRLAGALANDLAAVVVAIGLFVAASNFYKNLSLERPLP